MAGQGQHRIVRAEDVAHMGITEVLRHAPFIYAQYRKLVASIRRHRPDAAILIDFPDVNFRLAKHLQLAGIPVLWFVSPQLWAWKRSRLRWVQQRVDKMLVIFPFEETFYRDRGVDATFVGHPLAELPLPTISREDFAARHALDPTKIWIALLPGSRWKEVRAHLPALHELAVTDLIASSAAATVVSDGPGGPGSPGSPGSKDDGPTLTVPTNPAALTRFEFLLPVASTIDPAQLQRFIDSLTAEGLRYFGPEAGSAVRAATASAAGSRFAPTTQPASTPRLTLITGPDAAREALHHARASVVASGTATVQAALIGNPFVVVYRVSPLTFALAKKLVEYPAEFRNMPDAAGNQPIAMVNLIAQQRLVPELLQDNVTAANVATALAPLLADTPERARQIAGLATIRQILHPNPQNAHAITRVADAVLALLDQHK